MCIRDRPCSPARVTHPVCIVWHAGRRFFEDMLPKQLAQRSGRFPEHVQAELAPTFVAVAPGRETCTGDYLHLPSFRYSSAGTRV
eukprot:9969965-Alexandrium_andersonii.AAC.1